MTAPPRWRTWLALGVLVLLVVWMATDWSRFAADFWPLDASRVGPNLVASVVQAGLILVALSLIYPPTRRWIENYLEEHARALKAKVEEDNDRISAALHEKLGALHECLDRTEARVVHIIANTDTIPNLPDMEGSLSTTEGATMTDVSETPDAPVEPAEATEPEQVPGVSTEPVEEAEGE